MTRRKTHAEFVAEVEALVGDEYTVLGEYINAKTKITLKHSNCNNKYEVVPYSFLNGARCSKCSRNQKKNTEEFKQEVFELVGNEYSVLGEYKNSQTKITLKHHKCNYEYEVRPNSFLRGSRCQKCYGTLLKTTNQFKQEVFELVGNEYSVLSEYKNSRKKITLKHSNCNSVYEVKPDDFLRGSRCPHCNESRGERQVAELLEKLRIPYERQHKLDDCRNKLPLPFDFAVFNTGKSLKCLIEYDGEYHYIPKDHAGGEKGLCSTKRRDAIKTKYCADHNIPLIRIPYWEFDNIDEILTKELRKLGVIETQKIAS